MAASSRNVASRRNIVRNVGSHLEVEAMQRGVIGPAVIRCSLEDQPLIDAHRWSVNDGGYAINSRGELMHRLVMGVGAGAMSVDHISRDRLDNRRGNLRLADATVQVINQSAAADAALPRGVCYEPHRKVYRATATSHGDAVAAEYAISAYGRRGALVAAMHARMWMMIVGDPFVEGMFHTSLVNPLLIAHGLEPLPAAALAESVRLKLVTLYSMGVNLWEVHDGGRFAHLVDEAVAWSEDESRFELARMSTMAVDRLGAAAGEPACEAVERTVSDAIGQPRMPRGEMYMVHPSTAVPWVGAPRLDAATAAQTADDVARLAPVDIGRVVGERVAMMEVRASVGRLLAATMRVLASGRGSLVNKAMSAAMSVLESPSEEQDAPPDPTMAPKRPARAEPVPAPHTVEWVRDHVHAAIGNHVRPELVIEAYEAWCTSARRGKADGRIKLYKALRDAGHVTRSLTMFADIELRSADAAPAP